MTHVISCCLMLCTIMTKNQYRITYFVKTPECLIIYVYSPPSRE